MAVLFKLVPDRNLEIWNSMIAGYVQNGFGEKELQHFEEMRAAVSVLSACYKLGLSAAGWYLKHQVQLRSITTGMQLFQTLPSMENAIKFLRVLADWWTQNIRTDSITCLIVLSACAHDGLRRRAGRLKEAYDLMKRMAIKLNDAVLGAMLGSCQIHSNVQMAEQVIKLIAAGTVSSADSHSVLLSNTYAASEKWEKSEQMRRFRVDERIHKTLGCSSFIFSASSILK
ncbi:hypothetical protein PIB30_081963 [Stylosanthes scabra]|uniref:Pentatricopeptide repeat-containing protein n=1 Tax=Stylosanthes scabra TaxID=79078 RepID=A0ABU6RS51_9FABA|nr:hypothetical protein [Stylosanthes scabra]